MIKVGDHVKIKPGTEVYYAGINYHGKTIVKDGVGHYNTHYVYYVVWTKQATDGTHYSIIKKIDDRDPCITIYNENLIKVDNND